MKIPKGSAAAALLLTIGAVATVAAGACAEREAAATAPATEPPEVRRMAITVDDLPMAPPGRHTTAQQEEITERLLAVLAAHQVPVIGFVNEAKLEVEGVVDPRRVALLERWLAAGHELGNHGYAHLDLHRVDAETWLADALTATCGSSSPGRRRASGTRSG